MGKVQRIVEIEEEVIHAITWWRNNEEGSRSEKDILEELVEWGMTDMLYENQYDEQAQILEKALTRNL